MATLQDICLQITDGKHGDCQNEEGSGYYFISCKDVKDGLVDYSGARQITEEDYLETHRRTRLEPDDILITNSGTIGRIALVPRAPETGRTTFQKSVAILKPRQENVIPRWLYYCLVARKVELIAWAGGTAQKNLLLRDLRAFEVATPSRPTQRKIAAILSAYDDLIENNLQRIKILEEMAQLIYREWFVNFRFPGHERVRMVDSEFGPIPDRWDVVRTEDLVKRIASGKKYEQRTVSAVGAVPVLDQGQSGIIGYHDDEPGVRASEEEPVIVFANHTCYQRIIQYPFSAIQNVLPFVANPERRRNIYWLHWATKDLVEFNDYKGHWPEFMTKKLVCPPAYHAEEFGQVVNPLVRLIYKLDIQKQVLQHIRDVLLPKLISGELDVTELDIDTGEEPA